MLELSRLQELYINKIDNDAVGQQKQKARSALDNEYVGTRVSFSCSSVAFYGTVKCYFLDDRRAKTRYVLYYNEDDEDILLPQLHIR